MALIEVRADLKRVAEALERIAAAMERAAPPQTYDMNELTEAQREALFAGVTNDAQAWRDEVEARRANGETDEDILWRSYSPRS